MKASQYHSPVSQSKPLGRSTEQMLTSSKVEKKEIMSDKGGFTTDFNPTPRIESTKISAPHHEKHNERILIVDDEESLSKLLGDMLNIYGYQCTCFSSSNKALIEFSQSPEKFDLIISDQTMPELTGLEMIKKMREIRADIPAIIATGYSDSINDSIAKENNIELLSKPLPQEILLKTVNNIFKGK